jgi:glycosyltransferase involved in cell wall biosynthesis
MKILHVIFDLQMAGAQSLVVNIIKNINRKLFDVRLCVLYSSYNTKLNRELIKERIPVYYLSKHRGIDLRMLSRISRLLANFKPDIIHTHNYVMRYTIVPALLNRIPVRIHTLHTPAQHEVGLSGRIVHFIAFRFLKVEPVGVTNNVADSVRKLYGVTAHMIYNGIATKQFMAADSESQKKLPTIFINVSGFRPAKNHRLLIEAFAEALKANQDLKLFLVGNGPLQPAIKRFVIERNIEKNVLFLGVRNDIPAILKKSDVYVSTSLWEGFGLAVVEAMAAGKPIIATAAGGVLELVEDSVTGILARPNDVGALASAMVKLAGNADLRREMGERGRVRAIEKFNIKDTVRNYEHLYIKLYGKHT